MIVWFSFNSYEGVASVKLEFAATLDGVAGASSACAISAALTCKGKADIGAMGSIAGVIGGGGRSR